MRYHNASEPQHNLHPLPRPELAAVVPHASDVQRQGSPCSLAGGYTPVVAAAVAAVAGGDREDEGR